MGRLLPTDSIGRPSRWLLIFNRKASSWWTSRVALGRYKHVRAVGYVDGIWLFYDVQFGRTVLAAARGDDAARMMAEWCAEADILKIPEIKSPEKDRGDFAIIDLGRKLCRPLLCTTAVAHLVGLPGALRPDALYRQALRNGAVPIGQASDPPSPARSHAAAVDEDCDAAADAGPSI